MKFEEVPYESTKYTIVLSPELVKAYSFVRAGVKGELNGVPFDNPQDNVVARTFFGAKTPYPTFKGFLKPGGLIAFLLDD